jgi:exosortase
MNRSVPMGRNALLVAGLMAVVLAVYWPSASALWAYWSDPDNGAGAPQGRLVALLSLWMLFRTRHALVALPVRPVRWAYAALLACSVGSLIFWRAGIQSLQLLLLPALMFFAVLAAVGYRAARIVAFPLGYLYFAMPGWGFLAPVLQGITVRAISVLAPLMGLPVQVAGNVINLPRVGVFEITILCSGVNFLVAGLAVAALLGELEQASLRRRFWLVVIMGLVAIVSNWVRALLIIGIGYATNMRSVFATEDHLFFGWIVFAAVLLAFVWLAPRDPASESRGRPTPLGKTPESRWLAGSVTAAAVLAAVPVWVYGAAVTQDARATSPQVPFPAERAAWRGPARGRRCAVAARVRRPALAVALRLRRPRRAQRRGRGDRLSEAGTGA